jgi:hypothetical protein
MRRWPFSNRAAPSLRPLKQFEPEAPDVIRDSRKSAAATAEAVIDIDGKVVAAWYVDGDREWARVLANAVRGWKFAPATLDPKPIAARFNVSSTYRRNS